MLFSPLGKGQSSYHIRYVCLLAFPYAVQELLYVRASSYGALASAQVVTVGKLSALRR